MRAHTEHTQTTAATLRAEFTEISRRGYAECVEEIEIGVSTVAAPIQIGNIGATFSVAATGPTRRVTELYRATTGAALCWDWRGSWVGRYSCMGWGERRIISFFNEPLFIEGQKLRACRPSLYPNLMSEARDLVIFVKTSARSAFNFLEFQPGRRVSLDQISVDEDARPCRKVGRRQTLLVPSLYLKIEWESEPMRVSKWRQK